MIAGGLILARTPDIAIALPAIQAFSTGCLMNVDLVMRRRTLSPGDFQALMLSVYPHMVTGVTADHLPDNLLRFGTRFADGTKTTTVGQRFDRADLPQDPPPGPRLSWLLGGSSMRSGDDVGLITMGLWLWPLPPPETFELAVEWPASGINLTLTDVDGTAIVSAAQHSIPYWPDSTRSA
ncbi:hypothetical protein Aph01nite_58830 [Acrocarpospora phusangensis]|uniref:Uncharacterized protein n=1 Tax=Acrocarpospora phusangensis TaxID=1070424 RepID=A0A919URK3_9ACTN|nr:hypothetical protein Aph01nite_58830 [Acrocarpospora phusangensis]